MAMEKPRYRDVLERIRNESSGELVTVAEAAKITGYSTGETTMLRLRKAKHSISFAKRSKATDKLRHSPRRNGVAEKGTAMEWLCVTKAKHCSARAWIRRPLNRMVAAVTAVIGCDRQGP